MADLANGYRRLPAIGNCNLRTFYEIALPPGRHYWSVQAVDGAFAGSPFASERVIYVGPQVDGTAESTYGGALAPQGLQTDFGDNTLGLVDFANGSELDQAYMTDAGGTLYLALTGNLESNFNKLEVFFDTKPGGQNRLRGDNPVLDFDGLNRMGDDGSGNGLTFDPDFEPDYWMSFAGDDPGDGSYQLFAQWAELLTAGGGAGHFLGMTDAGSCGTLVDGTNPHGIRATINNSNTAGVDGGISAASGAGVVTGVEVAIPLTALGNPTGCIRVCAFVNGLWHDFVSNQVLGSLVPQQGNLGEPRLVNFLLLDGDQFFTFCPSYVSVGERPRPAHGASLAPIRPNPMQGRTAVWFDLPRAQTLALEVFDLRGARVRTLASGRFEAGARRVAWSGDADDARQLPSGLYFVRLRAGASQEVRRIVIAR